MSSTTLTDEYMLAVEKFGCRLDDLETLSINGMKSAFAHYETRCEFIYQRIKAGFDELRSELGINARLARGEAQS